jgi:sigma-E factor negative regulatory protein RseB
MLNSAAFMTRALRMGLLVFSFALLSIPVFAQTPQATPPQASALQVGELLAKMAGSSHKLNYRGTFTYQHKDNPTLNSFMISHWIEDGVAHERLQHLNGPEREISRSGRALDCQSVGDQLLLGKLSGIGSKLAQLNELYRMEIRGLERVAGRNATVLLAIPLDAYRYSYFLSIDNETGLVLKSWLVDESARPLERYQFVELDLDPDLSLIKQAPVPKLHRNANTLVPECNPSALKDPQKWQLQWIPPGFAFVGQKVVKDDIDMLMYTDGLTSFSVFIELTGAAIPEGVAKRGATLAAMDQLVVNEQHYRVTVVGEIPVVTAQKIAQNIMGI